MNSYSTIENLIAQAIGTLGVENTILVLEKILSQTDHTKSDRPKPSMVSLANFLTSEAIIVFELQKLDFIYNDLKEGREARKACFHLIHKLTGASYALIGRTFGLSRRLIQYHCSSVEDMLSLPKANRDFVAKHSFLEKKVVEKFSNPFNS